MYRYKFNKFRPPKIILWILFLNFERIVKLRFSSPSSAENGDFTIKTVPTAPSAAKMKSTTSLALILSRFTFKYNHFDVNFPLWEENWISSRTLVYWKESKDKIKGKISPLIPESIYHKLNLVRPWTCLDSLTPAMTMNGKFAYYHWFHLWCMDHGE